MYINILLLLLLLGLCSTSKDGDSGLAPAQAIRGAPQSEPAELDVHAAGARAGVPRKRFLTCQ